MNGPARPEDPAGFDRAALERFLRDALPDAAEGPMRLERIGGGQSNPTFFLGFDERMGYVLRKPPAATGLAPGAHAVDREVRILRALAHSDVPVPRVILFHADPALIGTPFYVMEWLEGRVIPWFSTPGLDPAERREMFFQMADTLARLHRVDWRAIGLADYGKPGNFFRRQVERLLRQWRTLSLPGRPEVDRLCAWLLDNIPADDSTTIAHGDFRFGNLMFHATEPRVVGVLDWELSTLGHPLSDVAYGAMAWHLDAGQFDGVRGLDVEAFGIPSENEYLRRYAAGAPAVPPMQSFHLVYTLFRGVVMAEGIVARGRAGLVADEGARRFAQLAPVFERRAMEIAAL